eukprot:1150765-Pelagomonas_calceolata.AAC.4
MAYKFRGEMRKVAASSDTEDARAGPLTAEQARLPSRMGRAEEMPDSCAHRQGKGRPSRRATVVNRGALAARARVQYDVDSTTYRCM